MSARQGFTLVEVAIVIAIIALIAGGIVLAKSLITNSELQSIITDVNRFKTAVNGFREKYHFLPGDLPNATTFWGEDAPCPGGSTANYLPRVETCDGDGDGMVGGADVGTPSTAPDTIGLKYQETLRAWQHLVNGQFIEGSYSGIGFGAGAVYNPGINVPKDKTGRQSGYTLFYSFLVYDDAGVYKTPDGVPHAGVYPGKYGHILVYGMLNDNAINTVMDFPALAGQDAENIDRKVDDGMPASGNVLTFTPDNIDTPDCINAVPNPDAYQQEHDNHDYACSLIFLTGF